MQGYRGKLNGWSAVSTGKNIRDVRALPLVNDNVPPFHLHSHFVKTYARSLRLAADSSHDAVTVDDLSSAEGGVQGAIWLLLHLHDVSLGFDFDTRLDQFLLQESAAVLVKGLQNQIASLDKSDLRAVTFKDACKLNRDIPRADDDDALRALLQVENFVASDDVLFSGNIKHVRPPPDRNHDLIGGDRLVLKLDGVRIYKACFRLYHLNTSFLENEALIDAVQAGDFLVLIGDETLPGRVSDLGVPSKPSRIFEPSPVLRSVHHELLRHASDVHARAPEAHGAIVGESHLRAILGRNA
mmetsp:Transcript_18394/g.34726  ORF Transcript_18394/g.34726 Transcript_18394/m.34726 type:complete len:298 (+) Transcript_18394:715-1608(+)